MKQLLLLLLIVFTYSLQSQPYFDFHLIDNTPNSNPVEIQAADLDGDNDTDIVAAFAGTSEIVWFENLGLNSFSTKLTIHAAANPLRVILADINNDGNQDILYSSANNRVSWFENTGNGTFSSEQLIDNNIQSPVAIEANDIDGDGFVDVAVTTGSNNEISWFRNIGNGTFSTKNSIANFNAHYLALGDLDHDGDTDLLTEDGQDILWYENTGNGNYIAGGVLDANKNQITGLGIEDVTGDGQGDAIMLADNQFYYRQSIGNGSFSAPIYNVATVPFTNYVYSDVTGNNIKDLLFNFDAGSDAIYRVEDNVLSWGSQITIKPEITDFIVADLNLDCDNDIISCGSNQIIWYENLKPIDKDGDGFPIPIDCNDADPNTYPGAPEFCSTVDNNCDGVISNNVPDFAPKMFMLPNTIMGPSIVEIAVDVRNLNPFPSDGSLITVRMPSDPRYTFVWDFSLTQAANKTVVNTDWNYQGDNGLFDTFTYNPAIFPASSSSAFGIIITYDPQNTDGSTTISATVIPFSGGECNIVNNNQSSILVYFE